MRLVSLAAAALALTASACTTASADKSAAERTARAAVESGGKATGKEQPWWRRYIGPSTTPRRPGDLPPGRRGLFSGKDGEIVLYRKGEADSSDPTKPSKVRR